jgi:hypothetical protein
MPALKSGEVVLQRIGRARATVKITGTAPLIMNKFSSKAKQMMLDKQMGKAVQRGNKDPEALFEGAKHYLPPLPGGTAPRYGMPSVAVKAAIVDAARFFPGSKLTMTGLKQQILVQGEFAADTSDRTMLVPLILKGEPFMREDHVRNETGVADIRFRPEFWPWSAVLQVVYVKNLMQVQTVVALVDAAGMGGLGEWRPASKESKTGQYGTFSVDDDFEVTVEDI